MTTLNFNGDLAALINLKSRFDVVFLVDVMNGIFNGDPDGTGQRVDPNTGLGVVTDVASKAILRHNVTFLREHGYFGELRGPGNYIVSRAVLNEKHQDIYKHCGISGYEAKEVALTDKALELLVPDGTPRDASELPEGFSLRAKDDTWYLTYDGTLDAEERASATAAFGAIGSAAKTVVSKLIKNAKTKVVSDDKLAELTKELCNRYWDVRTFGAVGSTGDSVGNVKGPWQILQGDSIDPIEAQEHCITRMAVTRIEDKDKKRQDMGRKEVVPYALFRFHAFFSPPLAERSKMDENDLKAFWTALYNYGRFSGSSMRGHIEPVGIYVFAHNHPLGNAHAHELFSRVTVRRRENVEHPRSIKDYSIAVDASNLPDGVQMIELYSRKLKPEQPISPPGADPVRREPTLQGV